MEEAVVSKNAVAPDFTYNKEVGPVERREARVPLRRN